MNGPENYTASQDLLVDAQKEDSIPVKMSIIATAQVHATLALAAATVDSRGVKLEEYDWAPV